LREKKKIVKAAPGIEAGLNTQKIKDVFVFY
jgi:hypothetical protein